MSIYPAPLEHLIRNLSRLPGIGQKSAARVALHILRSPKELAENLAKSLLDVKEKIRFCSVCFNFTDQDPCAICADESRSNGVLCIVEGPGDQLALEESGAFSGKYHVLHGVLSPLDGIGPEDLKISELMGRLGKEAIQEVILATNPTTEGESTVSFLTKLLSEKGIRISRIALGIPMGGDLKYMDSMTLRHALKSRTPVSP
jgi:recombination protein RecR